MHCTLLGRTEQPGEQDWRSWQLPAQQQGGCTAWGGGHVEYVSAWAAPSALAWDWPWEQEAFPSWGPAVLPGTCVKQFGLQPAAPHPRSVHSPNRIQMGPSPLVQPGCTSSGLGLLFWNSNTFPNEYCKSALINTNKCLLLICCRKLCNYNRKKTRNPVL